MKHKIPGIGIGMLGYGFMAKVHTDSLIRMPYIFWPPPAKPKLIKICGRTEEKVAEEAERYGYLEYCTQWQELIEDDRVEILYNVAPNNIHAAPCIAAAKSGKHIVCEKPLARNAAEAKEMLEAVNKAKVKNLCCFHFRAVPALAYAKQLIMEGKLGRIYHFRANWFEDWHMDPESPFTWRSSKKLAGSGAVGDLGSHLADLARWLCGEPISVMTNSKTFIDKRPLPEDPQKKKKVDVDDAFISLLEFENGAMGYLECSRLSYGHKEYTRVEVSGENGSLYWNQEDMNNLHVYINETGKSYTKGFCNISVTESYHPYFDRWWTPGTLIGYENFFVHLAYGIVNAIINDVKLEPMLATFEDGYRTSVICDAIIKSIKSSRKEKIKY